MATTIFSHSNNIAAEDSATECKLTGDFNTDDISDSLLLCRAYMQRVAHLEECLRQVSQEALIQTRAAANAEALALEAKDIAQKQAQDANEELKKQRKELSLAEKQQKELVCELTELHRHSEWQGQKIKELQDNGAAARIAKLHNVELEKMRAEHKAENKQLKQELKQLVALVGEQRQEISLLLLTRESAASCCTGDVFDDATTEPQTPSIAVAVAASVINNSSTQTEYDDNSEGWKHLSVVLQSKIDRQELDMQATKEETVLLRAQLEAATDLGRDLQEKLQQVQQDLATITIQQREEEENRLLLAARKQTTMAHTFTQTDNAADDPVVKARHTKSTQSSSQDISAAAAAAAMLSPSFSLLTTSKQLKLELELSKLALVDLIHTYIPSSTTTAIPSSSLPTTPSTTYCTPLPGSSPV